eukprot:g8457.t1
MPSILIRELPRENETDMSEKADDGAGAVHGKDKEMMKSFSWKQLGAGLMDDIRTRLIPYYISDFRDAFDTQCLSSIIFIFFACLTPAITFGGVMGLSTGGRIGVFNLDFLAVYPWIGIWISFFTTLIVLTNASQLVKYITRFTEDAFAALIAFIFLLGAFTSLHKLRLKFPLVILMFGTFALAYFLRGTHSSRYGLRPIRSFLSKFAMPITIVTTAIHGDPPMLKVLPKLSPTFELHSKLVSFWPYVWDDLGSYPLARAWRKGETFRLGLPLLPLINSPTNGVKKPPGYHLDLLICAGVILLCSLLGFPWMVGATVRSIAHEQSLTRYEVRTSVGRFIVIQAHKVTNMVCDSYEVAAKSVEYMKKIQSPPPKKGTCTARTSVTYFFLSILNKIHYDYALDEEAAGVSTSDPIKAPKSITMALGKIVPKSVVEQRVSSLMVNHITSIHISVHVLIGLVALYGRKAMSYIPLPVLYGVFLYMGVTATAGNQLVDRCLMLLTDPGKRSNEPYALHCSYWVIAKFTFIQLASIVVMIVIQRSSIAIVFPLLTILLIPLRWSLSRFRIFTQKELELLDSH